MNVKETTVYLYQNFELKHVTIVTDFRCFEKLDYNLSLLKAKKTHGFNLCIVLSVYPVAILKKHISVR